MKMLKTPELESVLMRTARAVTFKNPVGEIKYLSFEYSPSVDGSMNLSLMPKSHVFEMKYNTISGSIDQDQVKIMKENFGINAERDLFNELITSDTLEAEQYLLSMYASLGEKNSEGILTKRQKFLRKIFKKLKFPIYAQTGDEVFRKLKMLSDWVAVTSRRGPAHFVVVNSKISSLLKDSAAFVVAADNHVPPRGIYLAGTIDGLAVFVDPKKNWEETSIIVGRNTSEGDSGVYWVEGDRDMQEVQEPTLVPRKRLIVRTHRSIFHTENAESNYTTQFIEIKKKPLWRRLLKI